MSIIRRAHNKENPYAQISRKTIRNKSLSWGALGLLTYLLSLSSNWKLNKTALYKMRKNKETSTRGFFQELINAGYIQATHLRDDKGSFSEWEYLIFEEPQVPENPILENQELGNAELANQDLRKNIRERKNFREEKDIKVIPKGITKKPLKKPHKKIVKKDRGKLTEVKEGIYLSTEELQKLREKTSESTLELILKNMEDYQYAHNKHYSDHYRAICSWIRNQFNHKRENSVNNFCDTEWKAPEPTYVIEV